jgi:hypothetical protein
LAIRGFFWLGSAALPLAPLDYLDLGEIPKAPNPLPVVISVGDLDRMKNFLVMAAIDRLWIFGLDRA